MIHHPHIYLTLARAREEEILREAHRLRLAHVNGNERPSVLARLGVRRRRERQATPTPATA